MKTVAIYCRNIDADKYPFKEVYYWNAYLDLLLLIKARGAQAYFVTDMTTYLGNGVFSRGYTTDRKVPVDEFKVNKNIKADIVLEKGDFIATDVKVLNPVFVSHITESKIETYKFFSKYQPETIICKDNVELIAAIQKIESELIVVKEPVSYGGIAVQIGTRENVIKNISDNYPMIVQEFLDTSVGIKGMTDGMHDLRIKLGNGRVWGGTLRIPKLGEYRANVSQGGSERHLFPNEIPIEVINLALEIDSFFADYPRYYALDFANTPNGWKLIELNSKPGLSPVSFSEQSRSITESLADYLIELCD